MALLNINPAALGETFVNTAVGRAAQSVAQSMSPGLVQDVQRVLKAGNMIGQMTGFTSGIGLIDNAFSLGSAEGNATPLLGGLSMKQAQAIHQRVRSTRVALKNLFFVRLTEQRSPAGAYGSNSGGGSSVPGLGGLVGSVIGRAASTVAGAVGSVAGATVANMAGNFVGSAGANLASKLGLPGGAGSPSYGAIATASFDLLAIDVSYGPSVQGDHVQIGSTFMDRPLGRNPMELAITTMDDEAGTLKQWFQGKLDQVARPDGTFGYPSDYLVNIEIVHAIPSADVATAHLAYSKTLRLRPTSIQIEHSRRDQAVAELPMVFNQFDAFMGEK